MEISIGKILELDSVKHCIDFAAKDVELVETIVVAYMCKNGIVKYVCNRRDLPAVVYLLDVAKFGLLKNACCPNLDGDNPIETDKV